jgi:hypothetical protein
MPTPEEHVSDLTKSLVDEGKLLEAGFNALVEIMIPPHAPPEQIEDMRLAFFAGAQHLWAATMTVLEPGEEETMNDLIRMSKIQAEIDSWEQILRLRFSACEGGKQ